MQLALGYIGVGQKLITAMLAEFKEFNQSQTTRDNDTFVKALSAVSIWLTFHGLGF